VPAEAAAVANSGESVMTATPLIEALRASPLAPELNEEQVVALAAVMRLVTLPAKAVVEAEGSVDNRLVVVVDGSLGVIKSIGTADEAVLNTLRPGDFAHELGFLDGAARYSSLVALTDARVLTLEREALESLLDSHPRIVYRVMCAIVRVVHRIQSRQSVQASELTNYIVKQHGRY
jgi:CRP-like cAMP-binding protein